MKQRSFTKGPGGGFTATGGDSDGCGPQVQVTRRRRSGHHRKTAAGLLLLGLAGMSIAAASQLNVSSGAVAAGARDVSSCDTDGVEVSFTVAWDAVANAHAITDVDVTSIAVECVGDTLDLTFLDGSGSVSYSATAVISGTVESFANVGVAVDDAADVAIAIS